MIQHPIPQNVTGYQFRLIGDMTIKQFIFLSGGVAAAIFFYYTNLFSPIKWLFVISSSMLGFAIAFLPLEERPLDQWIINYIRAIYRPTRFIWKKQSSTPSYFEFIQSSDTIQPVDLEEISRQAAARREQGLRSYLITLPSESLNQDNLEQDYLNQISSLFNSLSLPNQTLSVSLPQTTYNIINNVSSPAPVSPESPATQETSPQLTKKPLQDADVQSGVISLEAVRVEKTQPETRHDANKIEAVTQTSDTQSNILVTENVSNKPIAAATTDNNLPFPSTPTTPNTIVGMVLDQGNKIVDNAIIEVLDESGLPVRATKTNQLGQFFSTTPLKRGIYHITIEKTGLTFDTIELSLVGAIVPPIKIQAK